MFFVAKYKNFKFCVSSTVSLLILLLLQPVHVFGIACHGCVDLDFINFDKTITRFPFAIVKFDIAFPYGEKHDAYAEFAKFAHKVTDDLLIATVGIKDYGEMENKELGERFNVADEKKYPGIFLFKGNSQKNYIKFPEHIDVTIENLKSFVTKHTTLYIGCEGCLKDYNILVLKFADKDNKTQKQLIENGEKMANELTKDHEKTSAKVYLLFMRKINERGYEFVEEETKRLLRLKVGKVNDAKRIELTEKLNILDSFRINKLVKNEL